jgi:hypothetical protein
MKFVLALLLASATEAVRALSTTSPEGVPAGAGVAGWERINAEAETDSTLFVYEFLVDPAWPGLYTITRYRTWPSSTSAGAARSRTEPESSEILIWNAHPGQRVPLLCYERVRVEPEWVWRAIEPGTTRYKAEMMRVMQVYGVHRSVHGLREFGR